MHIKNMTVQRSSCQYDPKNEMLLILRMIVVDFLLRSFLDIWMFIELFILDGQTITIDKYLGD
jgi:hypothetical protein